MKKIRCAIYTRKSAEEGLEQEFNSLDAQREACAAYVASQKAEGWVLLPTVYEDAGISGGTLERPGLDPGLRPGAWHPVAGWCFPCAYGEPESPASPPTRPRSGARHGSMTIETARRASLEFVCILGHDGQTPASPLPSASRNLTQPSCPRSPGRPIRQRLPDQQRMAQAPGGLLRFYHREAA